MLTSYARFDADMLPYAPCCLISLRRHAAAMPAAAIMLRMPALLLRAYAPPLMLMLFSLLHAMPLR